LVEPACASVPARPDGGEDARLLLTAKARALRERRRLPNEAQLRRLEDITPTMESLGDVLWRTRTLYSYDHASNLLKEAAVSGCRVLVVDEDGGLHDPEVSSCTYNIYWEEGFRQEYGRRFHDSSFVRGFVDELRTKWTVPGPANSSLATENGGAGTISRPLRTSPSTARTCFRRPLPRSPDADRTAHAHYISRCERSERERPSPSPNRPGGVSNHLSVLGRGQAVRQRALVP
jgi:hypothetical protein